MLAKNIYQEPSYNYFVMDRNCEYNSVKALKPIRGVSENFCKDFRDAVANVSKEITAGRKPKFVKVA